jgi:hypothetical protein
MHLLQGGGMAEPEVLPPKNKKVSGSSLGEACNVFSKNALAEGRVLICKTTGNFD